MRYLRHWTFARWIRLPKILSDAIPRPMIVPVEVRERLDALRQELGLSWDEFWDWLIERAE